MFALLDAAAKKAKSNDPVKLAKAMEGLKLDTPLGPMEMRADNHQLLQPLFVSTLSDKVKFDVEKSGLGFVTDEKIDAAKDRAADHLQDGASVAAHGAAPGS